MITTPSIFILATLFAVPSAATFAPMIAFGHSRVSVLSTLTYDSTPIIVPDSTKCPLLSLRSSQSSESSGQGVAMLDQDTREILAEEVLRLVKVPLVPDPIVDFVVRRAIEAMASDLSPETMIRLRVLLETENTYSESDDVSSADREALAEEIAEELSATMDLPILSEEQEVDVLRNIVQTALAVMTTSGDEFREARVAASLDASRELLRGDEGREKLARLLNAQVDVPFMREAEEQTMLVKLLGNCADVLQNLLPQELIFRLRGENTAGLKAIKVHLISRIDNRVELGLLVPREKKMWIIEKVVDVVIDHMVGDTEAELFLMDVEERRKKLTERRDSLMYEMDISRRLFAKQQEAIKDQIERINERLDELE